MRKLDRRCFEAILGMHSYLMMLLTSKGDRLFVFYDDLLSGIGVKFFANIYGGPEVTFSQHDFYKVNPIIYLTYLSYNFNEVERVLLSIQCLWVSVFYKVEKVLFLRVCPSTFIKSNEMCFQA